MEGNLYKELSYKVQQFRVASWLIGAVALLLCILIGIGCYILVIGMQGNEAALTDKPIKEEITFIEGKIREPLQQKSSEHIDFNEGLPMGVDEGVEPVAHIKHASNSFAREDVRIFSDEDSMERKASEIHPHSYKTSFSMRYPMVAANQGQLATEEPSASFLDTVTALADTSKETIAQIFNNPASKDKVEEALQALEEFGSRFITDEDVDVENIGHGRQKRSIGLSVLSVFPYASYASFANFLYKQVNEIAQYKIESRSFNARKLDNDKEANFLDGVWPTRSRSQPKKTIKKSSAVQETQVETVESEAQPKPATKKPWSPMVNQVPISFVGEILRTLLNLMKEYLMKDHVMECLWFMFCQDVNHTAKYSDMTGILARINSVGLKVLTQTDKQLREGDTLGEVWRSVTAWSPLQCEAMFPNCNGPKALEIVNEVALGSNNL